MNSEKLAGFREKGMLLNPKFDRLAQIGDRKNAKESEKKLSIKYNSSTSDEEKIYLEFTIETPTIKSSTATIFVEEINADNEIAVPKTIVTGLKSNSKQSFKVSFDKNKIFNRYTFQDNFSYQATLTIDGLSAKTDEFELKYEKTKAEKEEKCICKKTSWSTDDLKNIVSQLRKMDIRKIKTNPKDKNNNRTYLDKNGKVISSTDRGRRPKEAVKLNEIEVNLSFYDEVASDKKLIKDRLFYLNLGENIDEKDATYENFKNQLNSIFIKYKINTCLRKIHFLTQVYVETQRFATTYESDASAKKSGEDFYRGRGFVHVTHDYGYKGFYKHLNSKEPTAKELSEFVPKVASNLEFAIKSAAWYWQKNNINQYADKDDLERVSAAINYPNLLNKKEFNSDEINGLTERKKTYDLMKIIFNYENCK